jgi:hypothetical protein
MEISNEIFRALGMTLVHSLWQGAIIAVLVLFLMGLAQKSNAQFRYIVLFSGLVLLLVSFLTTFILVYRNNHLLTHLQNSIAFLQTDSVSQYWSSTPATITTKLFTFLDPLYPALALGWLAGFFIMSIRMTGSLFILKMNFSNNLVCPESSFRDLFIALKYKLGISQH